MPQRSNTVGITISSYNVLEVAQNVATLDGFVSLGKSNVTKKEF